MVSCRECSRTFMVCYESQMSRVKFRTHNTPLDNLVSNLRGEVGEIIFTWVLMRDLMAQAGQLRTDDLKADMGNRALCTLNILTDKMRDEIVARLAELAEEKIGRLTFYFVQQKLDRFDAEIKTFSGFVESSHFREKRNYDISHKELPVQWTERKFIHISTPSAFARFLTSEWKKHPIFQGSQRHRTGTSTNEAD
jgi:hypothetical protein